MHSSSIWGGTHEPLYPHARTLTGLALFRQQLLLGSWRAASLSFLDEVLLHSSLTFGSYNPGPSFNKLPKFVGKGAEADVPFVAEHFINTLCSLTSCVCVNH